MYVYFWGYEKLKLNWESKEQNFTGMPATNYLCTIGKNVGSFWSLKSLRKWKKLIKSKDRLGTTSGDSLAHKPPSCQKTLEATSLFKLE